MLAKKRLKKVSCCRPAEVAKNTDQSQQNADQNNPDLTAGIGMTKVESAVTP